MNPKDQLLNLGCSRHRFKNHKPKPIAEKEFKLEEQELELEKGEIFRFFTSNILFLFDCRKEIAKTISHWLIYCGF
jgi:hypothetical protein